MSGWLGTTPFDEGDRNKKLNLFSILRYAALENIQA